MDFNLQENNILWQQYPQTLQLSWKLWQIQKRPEWYSIQMSHKQVEMWIWCILYCYLENIPYKTAHEAWVGIMLSNISSVLFVYIFWFEWQAHILKVRKTFGYKKWTKFLSLWTRRCKVIEVLNIFSLLNVESNSMKTNYF